MIDAEYGVGAYKISGGASGAWIVAVGVSFALVAIIALLGGVTGWALVGLMAVLVISFRAYIKSMADLAIMYDQGRLSDEELGNFVMFHSIINIIANSLAVFSAAGKISTVSELSLSIQLSIYDFMISIFSASLSWWRR